MFKPVSPPGEILRVKRARGAAGCHAAPFADTRPPGTSSSNKKQPRTPSYDPRPQQLQQTQQEPQEPQQPQQPAIREKKLEELLLQPNADLSSLRRLAWKGTTPSLRANVWKILLGYLPANKERRESDLSRKRLEYTETATKLNFTEISASEETYDKKQLHQIHLDILRTNPSPAFEHDRVKDSLKRVLFLFAIRHPASGYVQGMNDLLSVFYTVFFWDYLKVDSYEEVSDFDVDSLPEQVLWDIEADSYWCLTKFLDGIQENYTFAQPGIQRMIHQLQELIARVDADLIRHFEKQNVTFLLIGMSWMNCLLVREIPLPLILRMWDTYFAEEEGISNFHVHVCAAFITQWATELKSLDFQGIVLLFQKASSEKTNNWTNEDIETLLSQGYMYKMLYHDSPNHFK